ncbi:unnamed protein product [Candidula unifasciata]|uniref:Choline/carnitine acyltransferase domain-containing protein n=1 Tax=Candidula unifasciata TaxID=100452 RepID=A0A8S4A164_9EUPU|nr:unnamed protein product [Candidula unifasciata]
MPSIEEILLSETEKTFQYDNDLLTLPVPDLSNTLRKYLESVRPLVTDAEYKKTELIVQQFAAGDGKGLHEKLQEKAHTTRNWLEQWWEDEAYLKIRLPRPKINMGSPCPYDDIWQSLPGSQIPRQALVLYYLLKFWDYVRREKYKPLKDGKGRPQCMYQFRRVFNTCNIPGVSRDSLIHYFKTESEGACPSHVLVASKGHIFILDTHDEAGQILTPPELQSQLQKIKDRSLALGQAQGVNYFTSEERTRWAEIRSRLIALHPHNYENLEKIQSSVIGVWLEDGNGTDATDLANKGLLGCGDNRWWDKGLSSGMYENGLCISNADHTPAEGVMMVYVTQYILAKLRENNGKWQGSENIRSLPEPELLEFVLDDHLRNAVEQAKNNYAILSQCATAEVLKYTRYGKNYCKQIKIHPDVYCQLAMQLAYYTLYGRMAPTYQTAPIKQFYHGRTETMRTCTSEAKAWCIAMQDPSVQNAEKLKLLLAAVKKHSSDFAEACEFRACDRHLLGLLLIAREEGLPTPELYQDPSFYKSGGGGNFILSTSCLGYSPLVGAVLPMCTNGIGAFYSINEEWLIFNLTTWNEDQDTSSERFAEAVSNALDTLRSITDQQFPVTSARL